MIARSSPVKQAPQLPAPNAVIGRRTPGRKGRSSGDGTASLQFPNADAAAVAKILADLPTSDNTPQSMQALLRANLQLRNLEWPEPFKRIEELRPDFDELLILKYRATNLEPFPFEWVDPVMTRQDYGSFLVRIASHFQHRC